MMRQADPGYGAVTVEAEGRLSVRGADDALRALSSLLEAEPGWKVPKHAHDGDHAEILYVVEGTGVMYWGKTSQAAVAPSFTRITDEPILDTVTPRLTATKPHSRRGSAAGLNRLRARLRIAIRQMLPAPLNAASTMEVMSRRFPE